MSVTNNPRRDRKVTFMWPRVSRTQHERRLKQYGIPTPSRLGARIRKAVRRRVDAYGDQYYERRVRRAWKARPQRKMVKKRTMHHRPIPPLRTYRAPHKP